MKSLIVVLVLLFVPAQALAGEPWTPVDSALYSTFLVMQIRDYRQTIQIAKNPDIYYETNPLLGRHPNTRQVDRYFFFATVTHYIIADSLKPVYRRLFLVITTLSQMNTVKRNLSIGLKF